MINNESNGTLATGLVTPANDLDKPRRKEKIRLSHTGFTSQV
jgi:hypothetical protein